MSDISHRSENDISVSKVRSGDDFALVWLVYCAFQLVMEKSILLHTYQQRECAFHTQ